MKECRKCGTRNPDGVKRCQSCGSNDLEYVPTSNKTQSDSFSTISPQAGLSQVYMPQIPMSYQVYDKHKESFYSNLGGFLKFMAYGSIASGILSILGGLIFIYSTFKLASLVDGYGNAGAIIRFLGFFGLVVYVILGIIVLRLAQKIIEKDYDFLRYIQIVFTVLFVICIILLIVDLSLAEKNYFYEAHTGRYIVDLFLAIIGFVVCNIYVTSSERVYYYMAGATYIKRSIYTSGVTRWDALEMSRKMQEDPSYAEKYQKQMANTPMYAAAPYAAAAAPVQAVAPVQASPAQSASSVQRATTAQTAAPAHVSTPVQTAASAQAETSSAKSSGLTIEDMEALKKLKELLDLGAISEEEYNNLRSKYISKETEKNSATETGATETAASSADTATSEEAESAPPQTLQAMEAGILGAAKKTTEKKPAWRCNSCGIINKPESKTCKYCGGVKLIVGYMAVPDEEAEAELNRQAANEEAGNTATAEELQMKFCGRCGSSIEPGAIFCVACGNKLV